MKISYDYINVISLTILILTIPFLLTPKAWSITPEEVLVKYEAKLKGLKSYKVETEERGKTIGPQGMQESSSHGRIFIKGNRRYSELIIIRNKKLGKGKLTGEDKLILQDQQKEENRIIRVFDGRISWLYDSAKKEVKKVDFSKLPANIQEKIKISQDNTNLKLPEGLEFALKEKILQVKSKEKSTGKRKFYVLTSKNTVTIGSQRYEKIILWIDAKEYLPSRIDMHSKIIVKIPQVSDLEIQTQVRQEFKNWELDVDIPNDRFIFEVPEGVKAIEATKETKILYERYLEHT